MITYLFWRCCSHFATVLSYCWTALCLDVRCGSAGPCGCALGCILNNLFFKGRGPPVRASPLLVVIVALPFAINGLPSSCISFPSSTVPLGSPSSLQCTCCFPHYALQPLGKLVSLPLTGSLLVLQGLPDALTSNLAQCLILGLCTGSPHVHATRPFFTFTFCFLRLCAPFQIAAAEGGGLSHGGLVGSMPLRLPTIPRSPR